MIEPNGIHFLRMTLQFSDGNWQTNLAAEAQVESLFLLPATPTLSTIGSTK